MPMLFPGAEEPKERPKATREAKGLKCAEPGCDGTLELRWSPKTGSFFYGCSGWPRCEGALPANEDGSPRGRPRTRELQGWRNRAHETFDRIWMDGHCSRGGAYGWLQEVMGMTTDEAHMYQMTIDQCKRVIEEVRVNGPGTEFWTEWRSRPKKKRKKGRRR
jgi:hypothetical protein